MEKYNKLTLIKFTDPIKRITGRGVRKRALFECECGNIKDYDYSAVRVGHTRQCFACSRKSAATIMSTHRQVKHPLYRKWQDMKKRCYNTNVDRYKNYGALGITVCDEWKNSFEVFRDWCIANGYAEKLELDRIDVHGNYEPSNCRFVTHVEQGYNKRNTFKFELNGITISLAQFVADNNIKQHYGTVWQGLRQGRTIEYYIKKYQITIGAPKNQ